MDYLLKTPDPGLRERSNMSSIPHFLLMRVPAEPTVQYLTYQICDALTVCCRAIYILGSR